MAEAKTPRRNPRGSSAKARENTAKAGVKTGRAAERSASPPVAVEPSHSMNPPAGMTEQVRREIEEAAYYRAQQRGFAPGYELDDWVAAEAEVMRRNGVR